MTDPAASGFGFVARGTSAGEGDGNGIIEGYGGTLGFYNRSAVEGGGETACSRFLSVWAVEFRPTNSITRDIRVYRA